MNKAKKILIIRAISIIITVYSVYCISFDLRGTIDFFISRAMGYIPGDLSLDIMVIFTWYILPLSKIVASYGLFFLRYWSRVTAIVILIIDLH